MESEADLLWRGGIPVTGRRDPGYRIPLLKKVSNCQIFQCILIAMLQ